MNLYTMPFFSLLIATTFSSAAFAGEFTEQCVANAPEDVELAQAQIVCSCIEDNVEPSMLDETLANAEAGVSPEDASGSAKSLFASCSS